jgi:hypothetical protein
LLLIDDDDLERWNRRQPDPAIVEAWETYTEHMLVLMTDPDATTRRIEREAVTAELVEAIKQCVEKGGG